jgi:uncharacterized membrane protein YfcA
VQVIAGYILFFIIGLLAEILGTIGGFGSSVLFVPYANFLMDYQSVLGITAVFHVFSNTTKIWLFRKSMDWKVVLIIGIPSVLLVGLGAWLSSVWKSANLQFGLGVFLCLFAIFFWFNSTYKVNKSPLSLVFFGGSAGFLAGLLGTGGALRGVALASLGLSKNLFVGTSAAIDFGVDATRAVMYGLQGYLHRHDWVFIFLLFFVAIIGSRLGKMILDRMSESSFNRVILAMIFLSGILLMAKVAGS